MSSVVLSTVVPLNTHHLILVPLGITSPQSLDHHAASLHLLELPPVVPPTYHLLYGDQLLCEDSVSLLLQERILGILRK